ncbi:hypothetical protein [Prochlorothrix hollandica]|nr:hypothetical protein [Prochlorothrix hollandica]
MVSLPRGYRVGRRLVAAIIGCGVVIILQGISPETPLLERILGAFWLSGSFLLACYAEQRGWVIDWPWGATPEGDRRSPGTEEP